MAHFSAETKLLIVANHVSWLDIPVLGSLKPMSSSRRKRSAIIPRGGKFVALEGVVYVDRGRCSCFPSVNAQMCGGCRLCCSPRRRRATAVALCASVRRISNRSAGGVEQGKREPGYSASLSRLLASCGASDGSGRTASSRVVRGRGVPSPFFQFVPRGGVRCDLYVGAPIRVSPSLERKSAARLAEASVRNLAIKARPAPSPALFGVGKALHKANRLETVIDRDKNV
jgi:lyso-ornithine lipid O-acyltransferase